jgi:hypothetical protein
VRRFINLYRQGFCTLGFDQKHAVLSHYANIVLLTGSLALGVYVFREQYKMQIRQQELSETQCKMQISQQDIQVRQQELAETQWLASHHQRQIEDAVSAGRKAFEIGTVQATRQQ